MKKRYALMLFLAFLVNVSWSQNSEILKTFKEVHLHYSKLKSFSMDVSIQYYNGNGEIVTKQAGSVLQSEEIYYLEMGGNTTLIRDGYYISANTSQGLLVFNKNEKVKKNEQTNNSIDITSQLDSLWGNQKSLKYKIIQSPTGMFRVLIEDSKNDYYDAYEITVDLKKKHLIEFVYYLKATDGKGHVQKVKVSYSNHSDNPSLKQKKLSVKNYISQDRKGYKPSDLYKNYQFIDQTKR